MKRWIPEPLYGAKPWVFIIAGAFPGIGMRVWSWRDLSWTEGRGLQCVAGAGGAILQLQQNYRVPSKFQRDRENLQ